MAAMGASPPAVTGREAIAYQIDEIAIIDGSEVIVSMNGAQVFAMSCFDMGIVPFIWEQELTGMNNYWCFPIHFGRHMEDPEWIFDPTKFRNPQIRITWSLNVGATQYADAVPSISVWAKIMEEGARPRGYLMTKELKAFITGAGGQEITYLPTDFPIRKLLVRAYENNKGMQNAIDRLKLSQDEDKWIPWDLNSADFSFLMRDWFPEFHWHMFKQVDDAETREHYGGQYGVCKAQSGELDLIVGLRQATDNTIQFHLRDSGGATPTDQEVWLNTWTRTPMDCWCYPFGDQDIASEWLQVAGMGNLRLILTQVVAGAGHECEIVVQQAHPY